MPPSAQSPSPGSSGERLTLGALWRAMRGDLGDRGLARVTVEYQQRSSTAPVVDGRRTEPGIFSKRMLTAEVDFEDRVMERATLTLAGMSGAPQARFHVQRHDDGYVYSLDGRRWGRFLTTPDLFDLEHFESELGHVGVSDVTIEQALEARRLREALDIDLAPSDFERLLRIFSADRENEPDDLDLGAFSVTVSGAEDLSLLYWWSLTGFEQEPRPGGRGSDTYASKVTCSVSIRLSALSRIERGSVSLDEPLDEVASIDEVWSVARRHTGEGSAS